MKSKDPYREHGPTQPLGKEQDGLPRIGGPSPRAERDRLPRFGPPAPGDQVTDEGPKLGPPQGRD